MKRSNNFDALRLMGAFMVIVGHAHPLTGLPVEAPKAFGYQLHTLGVVMFFSISGYLITASWTRTRRLLPYLAARCLRIFPALIVVVVVCAVVLGPLTTTLSARDYFADPGFTQYFSNIRMLPRFILPGVFNELPYPVAVNGALWTLPAEFFCYLLVPLACVRSVRFRFPILVALLGVALYLAHLPPEEAPIIYGNWIADLAPMWVFFAAGALVRTAHERWPSSFFRRDVAVLALVLQTLMAAFVPDALSWASWIFLPYAVIVFGLASTPVLRRAARFGDLSYGLYLWGFPVQQTMMYLFGPLPLLVDIPLVAGVTLALAWVSWHALEGPSMRLKEILVVRLTPRGGARRATGVPT